jgi:hypothetical protein
MSADIKRVDDVLSRFEKEKVVAATPNVATVLTPDKVKQDTTPSGPTGSGDLMALVRGRVRIDHSAASHAIQNAFQTTPSTASTPTASSVIKAPPRPAAVAVPVDAVESEEFIRQQNEFKEKSKASKRAKYKFKLKVKSKDGSSEAQASAGEDTADENNDKKQWKGTVGVIGRSVI